jgi:hypothetical protein
MTALVGTEVKRTLSLVPGLCSVACEILGNAAPEPQQADSKDGADFTNMGREVGVGGRTGHGWWQDWLAWATGTAEFTAERTRSKKKEAGRTALSLLPGRDSSLKQRRFVRRTGRQPTAARISP